MNNNIEKTNKKGLGRGVNSLFSNPADMDLSMSLSGPSAATGEQFSSKKANWATEKTTGHTTEQTIKLSAENKPATVVEKVIEKIVEQKIDEDKRLWSIAVDKLVPGAYQPRKNFDKVALEELASSIKENGILQPLVVRKRSAGGYEIVAGERRWRAAQLAGLHEIPVLIKKFTDQEALQMALIENIQREDLDPVEEAESYQRLIEEFNLSQQQAAEKVGKDRSTVANSLRLLALPNEIKNLISLNEISVGHAKVLLSIEEKAEQLRLSKIIKDKNLSVRALEQTIRLRKAEKQIDQAKLTEAKAKTEDMSEKLADQLASQIQKSLGTKTTINYKKGKGEIVIHFYSDDQLNGIYERLTE